MNKGIALSAPLPAEEPLDITFMNPTKRAFFVVGAEGSGTHLLWNALQSVGCDGPGWFNGWHKDYKFDEQAELFTMRRSFPHAGLWTDIYELQGLMENAGYKVMVLPIVREWNATIESVVRRDPDIIRWKQEITMQEAMRYLFTYTSGSFISYEMLVTSEGYRRWLFEERLGLPYPENFEFREENAKYYD